MSSPREIFETLLREHKQSITKSRLAVFDALAGQEPLTMREIAVRVPNIDRASVYRAVALFERLGIAQRLSTGWKYKIELSDKFAAHHHHLSCVRCGDTVAIHGRELETFIEQLADHHHFRPTAHQIEVQGLCAHCQLASSDNS